MLQSMRDNSKGVVAGILVGLLVIIFALSGAEALFSSRNNADSVAVVNGEEIQDLALRRAIEQQKQQLRNRYGSAVPEEFLSDENLKQPALDNLIQRELLRQSVKSSGMRVSDARMDETIVSMPMFQGADGKFDPQYYPQALRIMGYTPGSFRRELADDLTMNQLATGLSASGFTTVNEVDYLLSLTTQTRDFSYLVLDVDSVAAGVTVEQTDIQSYYDTHATEFTEPEKVGVEIIELSVNKLMEAERVSDEDLKKQFDENIDDYTPAVERHAAHILLEDPDAAEIEQVQLALDAGEDFAALAEQYSDDLGSKDTGGDLGVTFGDAYPEAFEKALASLEVGQVSGPVKTDSGTHFIKLIGQEGGEAASFDDSKEEITRQIKRARAEGRFVELLDQLEDLSYNAASLDSVGNELGLEVQKIEPFSRDGGTGLAALRPVITAAFSDEVLIEGNASEVVELAPDRVVVVKKTSHAESYVKPLAEVTSEIEESVRNLKADKLLAEKGQALADQLRSGTSFEVVAAEAGAELVSVSGISRNDMDMPRNVLELAFSMPKPALGQATIEGNLARGEYVLAQLTAVQVPAPAEGEEQRDGIANSLATMTGSADLASYVAYLRESAEIE